jgi:hypothetical protein
MRRDTDFMAFPLPERIQFLSDFGAMSKEHNHGDSPIFEAACEALVSLRCASPFYDCPRRFQGDVRFVEQHKSDVL